MDEGVAAVWRVILNGQAEWLAKQILSFELTHVRNENNEEKLTT